MKKIIKLISFYTMCSLLLLGVVSCNDELLELNNDPNASIDNPSLDLLFGGILPGFINQPITSYQIAGQLTQQFAVKNSDVGVLTHDEDAESRRFWEIIFSENNGALRNANFLTFEAQKRGNKVYEALGKIYKVYMLSYTTDLFGDIPYADAGKGFLFQDENFKPKYDTQENVYNNMLIDLVSANELLANAASNQTIDATRDLLYGGDVLKWRKFANTLRLRLLMRMSKVKDVKQEVSAIFNDSTNNPVFENINDEPIFENNQLNNWVFNDNNNINDIRISSVAVNIMKGVTGVNQLADKEDPRLSFLLNPTENSVDSGVLEYVGQPVGISSDIVANEERSLLSSNLINLNKFWLATYAEVLFIKAEAIHLGYVSGNVQDNIVDGVKASFEKYEIDTESVKAQNYLSSVLVNLTGNEIKHIATQRWLDQLNNGFEGYSVWRRMNYPTLSLGADVVETQIPTRYFYSSKTTDKNQENADAAINRAPLNGVNTTLSKVWWDVD